MHKVASVFMIKLSEMKRFISFGVPMISLFCVRQLSLRALVSWSYFLHSWSGCDDDSWKDKGWRAVSSWAYSSKLSCRMNASKVAVSNLS